MIVIPAVDLKDGKCVRLEQGDFNRATIYSDQPTEMAVRWQSGGAQRIHIVDLDGSLTGSPRNFNAIEEITKKVRIPVQVGGGIRNMDAVEKLFGVGVGYVILGTAALKNRAFVIDACTRYPGKVIIGIDAKNGYVAVEGWTEESGTPAIGIAQSYQQYGPAAIVYTDINRDGMGTGVNLESTRELAKAVVIPVIASGGVSGIHDLLEIKKMENFGVIGVIVGKALYSGAMTIEEAVRAAN